MHSEELSNISFLDLSCLSLLLFLRSHLDDGMTFSIHIFSCELAFCLISTIPHIAIAFIGFLDILGMDSWFGIYIRPTTAYRTG